MTRTDLSYQLNSCELLTQLRETTRAFLDALFNLDDAVAVSAS